MGRVKHAVRLFLLVAVLVAAALFALAVKPVGNYALYTVANVAETEDDAVTVERKNGATASVSRENGALVFDVVQSGKNFDDICVTVAFPAASYDTNALAEKLGVTDFDNSSNQGDENGESEKSGESVESGKEISPNNATKEEKLLSAFKSGAWLARVNFSFRAARAESVSGARYTLSFGGGAAQEREISAPEVEKIASTDKFKLSAGETTKIKIIFGAKEGGAMRSGRYILAADLQITGLSDNPLSVWEKIGVAFEVAGEAFSRLGLVGLIREGSFLAVYGYFCAFIGAAFLWKDLRNSFTLAAAVVTKKYVKEYAARMFLRGEIVSDGELSTSGKRLLASVFLGIVFYALWLALAPFRIIILAAADGYYAVTGDIYEKRWSLGGNVLLSFGTALVFFGAGIMAGGSVAVGLLVGLAGAGALVFGNLLCKNAAFTAE